jgi:hypothetical protein
VSQKPLPERIKIPVNPTYDLEVDPSENEFAYVNPVSLTNQLIVLANEGITLAEIRTGAERKIAELKLERRKVERAIEDLEERLLRDEPLSPSEAKSLKTIGAAVARRVLQAGEQETFETLRGKLRALDDQIEQQQQLANRSRIYTDTVEQVSENIKTALSYIKRELDASRQHGRYGA